MSRESTGEPTAQAYPSVDFFPLDQGVHDDFWRQLTEVRERCPVGWTTSKWSMTEAPGQWLINTYPAAMRAASAWETFSGAAAVHYPLDTMRMIPVETDPPMHREIRKALNPYFTPSALARNDAELTKIVDELIDESLDQPGTVDFVTHFASALPPRVLLGPGFLNQGAERGDELLKLVGTLLCEPERVWEIAPLLLTWCQELLELRRSQGERADLPGMIAHLGTGEDGGLQLSERERIETLNLTVLAGMDTTMGGIGTVAWKLAIEPDCANSCARPTSAAWTGPWRSCCGGPRRCPRWAGR